MVTLLDTNAFLWWLADDARLGEKARSVIASPSNAVYVSNLSLFECAIKAKLGKLTIDLKAVDQEISEGRLLELRFDTEAARHFVDYVQLPHSDPFDTALVAQAIVKRMTFITSDNLVLATKLDGLLSMDATK